MSPRPLAALNKPKIVMPKPGSLADGLFFVGGAAVALLLFCSVYSLLSPASAPAAVISSPSKAATLDPGRQPATFYDDPSLSYTIDKPITNWDEKRRRWLSLHPPADPSAERIVMVTGSQPGPCRNPIGDHLLLRFYKNKADYCRIHNIPLFYNTALLHPRMFTYWAKMPAVRAAMVAHPEAEWIWWVDSDAALTDMDAALPLARYRRHNLVVHGWPDLVYKARSWTSLNAGVFLIRNCQWSLDFIDVWSRFGPQSPGYNRWGKTLRSKLPDKAFPESDDQSALVYLLLTEKSKYGDKIYLENEFYFEGYWVEIVSRLANISAKYNEVERRTPELRRRRAEVDAAAQGRARERRMGEEPGWRSDKDGWRRPFITHFTGCQPCSGDHNKMYSGVSCYAGMERALNFADDQVLRGFGFRRPDLMNSSDVRPAPFDFPAGGGED